MGAPSSINGGTTDINRKCCPIWALSSTSAKPSTGEAIASHRTAIPLRKHASRSLVKYAGRVLRMSYQPRTYTAETQTIVIVNPRGNDHAEKIA
jgi:hypothetical protein